MTSRNMSCTRAWLISTWGISEVPSGTSCTRATRVSGLHRQPGVQKVVSLIQTDSRMTFSAKPKAWNISIERTLMPSAWPFSIGPEPGVDQHGADLRHPGELGGQAQAGRPRAGDQHIHRFVAAGRQRGGGQAAPPGSTSGSPGLKPSRWNCMVSPSCSAGRRLQYACI